MAELKVELFDVNDLSVQPYRWTASIEFPREAGVYGLPGGCVVCGNTIAEALAKLAVSVAVARGI